MAPQLKGIRVLVTRPEDPDSEFVRLLRARGATIKNLPLIAIAPPANERELATAVDNAETFDWIAFTSAVGVESFANRRTRPLSKDKPLVAAVGPATARAIHHSLGREPDLVPPQFSGEALADALLERARKKDRILVIQAADARPALAARLRAAGLYVETPPAYTTVFVRSPKLEEYIGQTDVVTLASPSAVHSLVRGLGKRAAAKLRGKLVACIGPVTLFEARQAGLHVEIVPESATTASLVDALCRYYSKTPPQV